MSEPIIEAAEQFLRAHTRGDLRFDEHLRPVRYVIAPCGRLLAPVMVAMLQSFDNVLFVPEFAEGAMEVQVTLEQFEEHGPHGALADRWRIHHGEPQDVRWAFIEIDAARFEGSVIDGTALRLKNPLADLESKLCRAMNHQRMDDLRALCGHFARLQVESPVMVAIDPGGLDVRGRFEVVRIASPEPMSGENVQDVLDRMIEQSRGAESDA
jgi:hypothetical protein